MVKMVSYFLHVRKGVILAYIFLDINFGSRVVGAQAVFSQPVDNMFSDYGSSVTVSLINKASTKIDHDNPFVLCQFLDHIVIHIPFKTWRSEEHTSELQSREK